METINGRITIRDILLEHDNWQRFVEAHGDRIRPAVYDNVRRMLACRTPELGFHVYACAECGHKRIVPHTCKSRLCSSCGKPATDRWVQEVLNQTLDVEYHPLVLSVAWQLRLLTLVNRRVMLNIFFRWAAEAIISWCQTYHNVTPGLIEVMHTFGGDLKFHPHVHVLVTAGGLSLDGKRWVHRRGDDLMPEAGLKKRWRYQVTSRVNQAYRAGELTMPRLSGDRRRRLKLGMVMAAVLKLIWYVMIGTSLKQIGFAVSYIGRYTRRPPDRRRPHPAFRRQVGDLSLQGLRPGGSAIGEEAAGVRLYCPADPSHSGQALSDGTALRDLRHAGAGHEAGRGPALVGSAGTGADRGAHVAGASRGPHGRGPAGLPALRQADGA